MTRLPVRGRQISRSDIPTQFVWYLVVGGLSYLSDLAVFAALLDFDIPVKAALVVGFVVGTLLNYVLSRIFAFTGGRYRPGGEIAHLFVLATAGLALTAFLVTVVMTFAGMGPLATREIATIIALAWNYFGRRLFVFYPEMPVAFLRLSGRVLGAARTDRPLGVIAA